VTRDGPRRVTRLRGGGAGRYPSIVRIVAPLFARSAIVTLGLALGAAACGDGGDATRDTDDTTVPDTSDTSDADLAADDHVEDGPGPDDDATGPETEDGRGEVDDATSDATSDATDAADAADATASEIEIEVVTTEVRPPDAGELAIVEIMIDPIGRSDLVGEWIELANLTDDATLDLAGCWIADGEGRRFELGQGTGIPRAAPGERYLLARSGDASDNGGLAPDLVYDRVLLANAAGSLAVGCDATTLDAVSWDGAWPIAPGRALVLDPGAHAAASACAATALYDGLNRGTPGVLDAPCPAPDTTIDDCGLVAPEAGAVRIETPLEALVWVDEAGATDLSPGIDTIPRFVVEIGLAAGADPAALVWTGAEPRPAAQDPARATRDHHGLALPALTIGPWLVSARASLDRGQSWRSCGTRALVVEPSPCDPSPCVRAEARRCEGDTLVVDPAMGACAIVSDEAECTFVEQRVACERLAGRCDDEVAAACVEVAEAPLAGEIVIHEIMKAPGVVADRNGEWVELLSLAPVPRQLSGCELVDDGTDRVTLADSSGNLTIWPGQLLVLAASVDRAVNGTIDAAWGWGDAGGQLELLNAADALILRCGGVDIDAVRWTQAAYPVTVGSSMQLSPRRATTVDNDVGAAWCVGRNAIQVGTTFPDYGSPGAPNPPCPEAVERCRLVAPPTLEVVAGQPFEVQVQLRHPRLTDLSDLVDDDGWVLVSAGLGNTGWYPSWGSFTWTPGAPDLAWRDATPPQEDAWRVTIVAPTAVGDRDLAGRVSIDDGRTWTDCDRDTGAAGSDGSQDGYQTASATRVTIVPSDPCRPSPCTDVPLDVCDDQGRLARAPAEGVCTVVGAGAACDYPIDVVDCAALGGTCDAASATCPGAAAAPRPGDVVISEVMPWPAVVADFFGEWIELESVAVEPLNLAGCELADAGASVSIDRPGHALVIAAGGRLVLGRDGELAVNGGVAVDYVWGGALGLGQDGDTITLTCGGVVIDALVFDASFPFALGVAMQLDPGAIDASTNDDAAAWCAASATYGAGDRGTPGAVNDPCPP